MTPASPILLAKQFNSHRHSMIRGSTPNETAGVGVSRALKLKQTDSRENKMQKKKFAPGDGLCKTIHEMWRFYVDEMNACGDHSVE